MKTPIEKPNEFIVINQRTEKVYVVNDASSVARLIDKTARTLQNWFAGGKRLMILKGDWYIIKGYERIKSERGNKGKGSVVMTEVQDTGDF